MIDKREVMFYVSPVSQSKNKGRLVVFQDRNMIGLKGKAFQFDLNNAVFRIDNVDGPEMRGVGACTASEKGPCQDQQQEDACLFKGKEPSFHFSSPSSAISLRAPLGIMSCIYLSSFPSIPIFHHSNILMICYMGGLNFLSLNALETTVTDENAIAPAAKIGFRRMPKNGKRMPAATGIKIVL